jgi:DNA helicase-2/ATP-dependent DNA helicase PcrA
MEEVGYRQHIAQEHPGNEQAALWRYKSVETFLALFSRWEQDPDGMDRSVYDYLQRLSLTQRDRIREEKEEPKVALMTMHASKGLEFDTVFLLGIEDHIIPHARTLEEDPLSIEEERRLFYVAITRARRLLHISSCAHRKRGREVCASLPSRFLSEIPGRLFQEPQEDRQLDAGETLEAFERLRRMLAEKESS